LSELCLSGALDVTSVCVAPLSQLSALVALDISSTAVSDAAYIHLTLLTQLTRINIACTDCGVRIAEALTQLPRLREVSICGSAEWRHAGGHAHQAAEFINNDHNNWGAAVQEEMSEHDERRKCLQGVPAVLALVPCMKLKHVVVPEKILKDTRRSVEGCGGHVPAWMWGVEQKSAARDLWKPDLI
jgi:hypothetical protein